MPPVRVLTLTGKPYEMGQQHGAAYADDIRAIAADRLHLCTDDTWTGRALSRERVLELAAACIDEHWRYAPQIMEEVEGIAAATGLTLPELVIANGFTDFVDVIYNAGQVSHVPASKGNECTSALVGAGASLDGSGYLAQTWDMHATATPYVIWLRGCPTDSPAFLACTITGCVGMIGMNEAGIVVGINNLVGADGQPGVTWPFVVRKILMQTNLEDALDCITSARLAGAHNYMLLDANGRGYNVEAMSTVRHIEPLNDVPLLHANQCEYAATRAVERPLTQELIDDSTYRVRRAAEVLNGKPVTLDGLMALMRDDFGGEYAICSTPHPPFYSETCCAAIMRPASREMWAVWGLPNQNEFERLTI